MSRPILVLAVVVCVGYALLTAAEVVVPFTLALLVLVAVPVLAVRHLAGRIGGRR